MENFGMRANGGRALFELETTVAVGQSFLTITYPSKGRGEGESGRISDFFKGLGVTTDATKYSYLGIDGNGTLIVKNTSPSGQENFYFRFKNEGRGIIIIPTYLKEFPRLKLEVKENQDSTISLKLLNRPFEKK
jgi:hypothetical protein